MIINLYIEINRKEPKSEFERLVELEKFLDKQDMRFHNATSSDSYTSGPCKLNTFDAIVEDLS